MESSVLMTLIICGTVILLALIGSSDNNDKE